MPELPEVQSMIDNLLEERCTNLTITDVSTIMPKLFKNCNFNEFRDYIINEQITNITRIGKYLIFHLTNNKIFVNHLRMEGKLFFEECNSNYDKNHTLVFIKMGEKELRYHDTRRFGTFTIYNESNFMESKELSKIALDPLDKNFNFKYLQKNISNKSKCIKTALLDQSNVAGIGNIYADEILYASKIHPESICKNLNESDFKNIAYNSTYILKKAVENKGTTISTYFYKKEKMGEFQKFLKVHTKKDYPCECCNNPISKIKVNGRGTYLCQTCQIKK